MSKYIDELECAREIRDALNIPMGFVLTRLKNVPTADVVEVVRCKDCQYWTGKDYDGCCIKNGLATRYANDYCSYGERKEE